MPAAQALNFLSPIAGYIRVDNSTSFAYTYSNGTGKLIQEHFMVFNTTDPNNTTPIPPGAQMYIQVSLECQGRQGRAACAPAPQRAPACVTGGARGGGRATRAGGPGPQPHPSAAPPACSGP
jgi:hypothetical protein